VSRQEQGERPYVAALAEAVDERREVRIGGPDSGGAAVPQSVGHGQPHPVGVRPSWHAAHVAGGEPEVLKRHLPATEFGVRVGEVQMQGG